MKEETRKQMQQKMAAYKETAPEVSWAAMEKALAAGSTVSTPQAFMWRRWIAVAAAVLLIAGAGLLTLLRNDVEPDYKAEILADIQLEEEQPSIKTETEAETELQPKAKTLPKTKTLPRKKTLPETEHLPQTEPQPQTETQTQANPQPQTEPLPAETTMKTQDTEPIEFIGAGEEIRAKSNRKLIASVYVSSLMNGSANTFASGRLMYYCAAPMGASDQMLFDNNSPALSPEKKVKEKGSHRQPVRFGLSLRYPLGGRVSIDGGLSYSLLVSTIHSTTNGMTFDSQQKLNYIGIPVRVNYDLLKGNRFNLYTSAGGSVEKMVKGRRDDRKIYIRPLQYTMTCAAGAELRLNPVSLYVEPGLSYHFKNGCHIPTYYNDKPLGFDLSIGLRFNLE